MSSQKILVTGAAGFIGYHLCKSLLADGFNVLGIDNINDYYDVNLKYARLKELGIPLSSIPTNTSSIKHLPSSIYKNFSFCKLDIADREAITQSFQSFNPSKVVNLAAQAGVRYSIKNPYAYMNSNLVGFLNIIELCRHNEVEGFIYASSSSVYGGNTKIPFSVEDQVDNPISIYAASKRANELIAHTYSHLYGLHTTGLRFFTVYGPWGRPDMAMLLFTRKILTGKPIPVFNNGNMKRDFTYIDDIVCGIKAAIDSNYVCEVFNLGSNKSEDLLHMIALIEKELNIEAIIDFQPLQPGDIKESLADIGKSKMLLGFNPKTNIEEGIKEFISWYKEYQEI